MRLLAALISISRSFSSGTEFVASFCSEKRGVLAKSSHSKSVHEFSPCKFCPIDSSFVYFPLRLCTMVNSDYEEEKGHPAAGIRSRIRVKQGIIKSIEVKLKSLNAFSKLLTLKMIYKNKFQSSGL